MTLLLRILCLRLCSGDIIMCVVLHVYWTIMMMWR